VLAKQSMGGAAARVRAYVRGRRGGWAGGCRASGRRAGPAGRPPSAGSAAPASSAACFPPLPQRNPLGSFFCSFPVCSAHLCPQRAETAARAQQLASDDAGGGARAVQADSSRLARPGSGKTESACCYC
jgi:hypothetical protein